MSDAPVLPSFSPDLPSRATQGLPLDGRDAPLIDLDEEHDQAALRLVWDIDRWKALAEALDLPPQAFGFLGIGHARFCKDPSCERWEPAEGEAGATEVLILPVHEGETIIDLVAWRPDRPRRWWLRTGAGMGVVLGHQHHVTAQWEDTALLLHETPADWLAAGGEGACILDWRPESVRAALSFLTEFTVPSIELGERLDTALTGEKRHRIKVGRAAA